MKVLMISGDKHLLEEGTEAHARLELQKREVEQLDVFVWPQLHSARRIREAIHEIRYDVITVQDPFWRGLRALRAARMGGAKLNVQVHTDLSAQPFLRRMIARFVLRRADTVRVVSQKIAEQLSPLKLKARVSVLPVYIDVSRFEATVRVPHAGPKIILWVGRFEAEKNPLAALDILESVRNAGEETKLVMLGAGSLEARLREEVEVRRLPVEFPGWQDPATYLTQSDVVVSTSRHESYGASIIEALAAGVPVVAPDIGVAREAGAIIASRAGLADMTLETLRVGEGGKLKLRLLDADAWAKAWRTTLL